MYNKYQMILVDEFQDTNELQEKIIAILSGLTGKGEKECEEALLKNNGNISKTVKSNL